MVAFVAWQHWRKDETIKGKRTWQGYVVLLMGGLFLMAISFAPYLPSSYRNSTFRVFYLPSLGAALVVATLIRWGVSFLKQYGKIPAVAFTGVLVILASYNTINQFAFFVEASDSIQRMLAGVLTSAPAVSDGSIIIFVDETGEYQDQWHMGGSTLTFLSAIQYLYFDDYQDARFCTVAPERPVNYCSFRSDAIIIYGDYGAMYTIPYQNTIIMRTNYHGGFELLEEIPEEYVKKGDWQNNLDQYRPHNLIDDDAPPPARAKTFFACWPITDCLPSIPATPQTEVHLEFDTPLPGFGWEPSYGYSASWTNNPISILNLNLAPNHDYLIQFSIGYTFDPAILDSLTLAVNNFPIPLQRSSLNDSTGIFSGVIPAEVVMVDSQNTKLAFKVDRVVSPKELGINEDSRPLGVSFDWLQIEPINDSARLEFDTTISGTGWSVPEGSAMWTNSTESTLDILINTRQTLMAEFRITYTITNEILNSLQFFANDVELPLERQQDDTGGYLFRATIPQDVLAAGEIGVVHLKFTIAMTANPQAMGINNDSRDLGLLFDWIELHPAAQP